MRHSLAASEQDFCELPDDQIRSKANISAGNQILGKILPKIFSHKIMPNQILFKDQHFGERLRFHKHRSKALLSSSPPMEFVRTETLSKATEHSSKRIIVASGGILESPR